MSESKTTLALGEQILEFIAVGLGRFARGEILLGRRLVLVRTIEVVLRKRRHLLFLYFYILLF